MSSFILLFFSLPLSLSFAALPASLIKFSSFSFQTNQDFIAVISASFKWLIQTIFRQIKVIFVLIATKSSMIAICCKVWTLISSQIKSFLFLHDRLALDKMWHEDCLKCACCDCRLGETGSTLYLKANLILCKRDYLRLFGMTGHCASCQRLSEKI